MEEFVLHRKPTAIIKKKVTSLIEKSTNFSKMSFRAVINTSDIPKTCFLCQTSCDEKCNHCNLVYFCCEEHFKLHRLESENYCFPYRAAFKEGIGRILVATRTIKAMELILIDPGTVIGPNYTTTPACLECLRWVNKHKQAEILPKFKFLKFLLSFMCFSIRG